MDILQLCKKFPFPLKDGESIAVTYLSRAYNVLNCKVSLLAMNTSKHYTDIDNLPTSFSHYEKIECTYLDNNVTLSGAVKNLFDKKSFHLSRFYSVEYKERLISMLKANTYDVVQIESLYLAQYVDVIRKYSNALIVMRAHNVEHEIWDRITANTQFPPKRIYLKYLSQKLKNAEKAYLSKYDYLLAITSRDMKKFKEMGYKNSGMVAPIGLKIEDYIPHDLRGFKNEIKPCFIGSLDWVPNIEGMNWFLDEIWPSIAAKFKDIELDIAGRNAINEAAYKRENTVYHGEVDCAREWLNNYNVMVVPLLSGSGMRAKIIEAMALGMVVITTTIGLEGIPAKHKKQVLVADTREDFLKIFEYLHQDYEKVISIGKNARSFVSENYDNISIASQVLKGYKHKLGMMPEDVENTKGSLNLSLSM